MEGLREAAEYYLKTASEECKQRARIALDSGESLEDFYIRETKRRIRRCDVCAKLLVDFYYCCIKCEICKDYNYNLCIKCFYGGTFQHNHDSFADNHSVLTMHGEGRLEPSCVIEKKPEGECLQLLLPPVKVQKRQVSDVKGKDLQIVVAKKPYKRPPREAKIEGLETLANIADAHYNAATEEMKKSADEFFWSMVKHEGKCSVTQEEFLEWMNEKGYTEYGFPEFFQALVKDRNEGMSLSESKTLYYILMTRRPFCSRCGNFIPDIYFCCSKCSATSYALCLRCYASKAYIMHKHYRDRDVFFFDYTVLHTTIKTTSYQQTGSSSMAIVERYKPVTAWKVFKATLNVGGVVLSIASAFGSCTIM